MDESSATPKPQTLMEATHAGRRRFLRVALGGLLALGMPVGCGRVAEGRVAAAAEPQWFHALFRHREAVLHIGVAYLETRTGEQRDGFLLQAIEQSLTAASGDAWFGGERGALLAGLNRVIRAEYRRGDVVDVGGWILSQTEARVYALVAST